MEFIIPIIFIAFLYYFFKPLSLHNNVFKQVEKSFELHEKMLNAKLKQQQDYACNHCNAILQSPDDISPSGDVKCHHCDQWFNVYQ